MKKINAQQDLLFVLKGRALWYDRTSLCLIVGLVAGLMCFPLLAADTSAQVQLEKWSVAAGRPGNATQGEELFNQKHGDAWSCASCHNSPPTTTGKHASTSKPIKPLAPALNAEAFTDTAKIDKWFKRNCRDVMKRECTPAEKADVMAYLLSLKK